MNTARGAYLGARTGWNEGALVPSQSYGWDEYAARLMRYQLNESYYNNIVYTQIAAYVEIFKAQRKLYRHIRGIYNPVSRYVDLYPAKVYGGQLDTEDGSAGAIPLLTNNAALKQAIIQIWNWSGWDVEKTTYVQGGTQLGDVFLKTVDDKASQRVRMEVLHPSRVRYAEFDQANNIKLIVIEYDRVDEVTGVSYSYCEIIDQEKFYTYRNGEPYAYVDDGDGNRLSEWDNEYGFVPVVLAPFKRNMGVRYGATGFHTTTRKIDELNDAAAILNDSIRKAVNFALIAKGMKKGDVTFGVLEKDQTPIIYIPGEAGKDQSLVPLVVPVNVADGIANLAKMIDEIKEDMPELKLASMSEGAESGVAVKLRYSDAIDKIIMAQGTFDAALVRAQQMAVTVAAVNHYPGFEDFDINSYERGDLAHAIAPRPVVDDTLSKQEKLTALPQASSQPPEVARTMFEEMGYDKSKVDLMVKDIILQRELEARTAAAGFGQSIFGSMTDGEEADTTTEPGTVTDRPGTATDAEALAAR